MNAPASIRLSLPPELASEAERLAQNEGVSLEDWIAWTVAERVGDMTAVAEFFHRRAQGARPGAFLELLARAPDVPPMPGDELPEGCEPPR